MLPTVAEEVPEAEDDDVGEAGLQHGGVQAVDAGKGEGGNPLCPRIEPRCKGDWNVKDKGL